MGVAPVAVSVGAVKVSSRVSPIGDVAFGADAFNIFNYVRFGMAANYNNITITNLAFGKVGSQNNLPRVFQFRFRVEY